MLRVPPAGEPISRESAVAIARQLGVPLLNKSFRGGYPLWQWERGLQIEREHLHPRFGGISERTDVASGEPSMEIIARIAWAHLKESPIYYSTMDKFMRLGDCGTKSLPPLKTELDEHFARDEADLRHTDPLLDADATAQKIADAHILKRPDYYVCLAATEDAFEAKAVLY